MSSDSNLDAEAQLSIGLYLYAYNLNSILGAFGATAVDPEATLAERMNAQFAEEASSILEYLFKAGVPFPSELPASLKLEAWEREKAAFDDFTKITAPDKQSEYKTKNEFASRAAEWKRLGDLVMSTELVLPAKLALGTFSVDDGFFPLSITLPALDAQDQGGNPIQLVTVRGLDKADIRYYIDRKNAPFFKDKGFAAWTATAVISPQEPGVYVLKEMQVKNGKVPVTQGLWAFAVREAQNGAGETTILVGNYLKGKEYDSARTVLGYGVSILKADDGSYSLSSAIGGPGQFDTEVVSNPTPDFDWPDIDGAKGYDFQLCTKNDFVTLVSEGANLSTSSFSQKIALSSDSIYYWRIRAKNATEAWGAWSATWSFTIGSYAIGDTGPAGGLVFYDKGSFSDGWRYLEAAPMDQSGGIQWYNGSFTAIATDTAVGTGKANTDAIIAAQGEGNYAAALCKNLTINGLSDWFLPSKDELDRMYENLKKAGLGSFSGGMFWSSSQGTNIGRAWVQSFSEGDLGYNGKDTDCAVRACRAF
jgi:hypothetical protein